MSHDDILNTLPREGLLPEPRLDVVEHLRMGGVILIQHVLKLQVRRAETVAEMLSEDPPSIYNHALFSPPSPIRVPQVNHAQA